VTVGGGAVDNYPIWTNTKITFQLGAAVKSGDMVVHVASKGDSNALPFTVRAGNGSSDYVGIHVSSPARLRLDRHSHATPQSHQWTG
jgi:hypothetical protein